MLFYIVWDILRGTVTITSSIMKGLDICLKTFSTYNTYTSKNPFQFKIIIVICIYVLFIYRFQKATINRHILPNSAQYIYLLIFINNRVKIIWITRGLICIYILFSVYYLGFLFNIFKLTSLYFSFLPCFSLSFPPRVFFSLILSNWDSTTVLSSLTVFFMADVRLLCNTRHTQTNWLFVPSLHPHYRDFFTTMDSADFSQFVVSRLMELLWDLHA